MTTTPSGPTKEEIIKIKNESKISYNFHFKLNENNIRSFLFFIKKKKKRRKGNNRSRKSS